MEMPSIDQHFVINLKFLQDQLQINKLLSNENEQLRGSMLLIDNDPRTKRSSEDEIGGFTLDTTYLTMVLIINVCVTYKEMNQNELILNNELKDIKTEFYQLKTHFNEIPIRELTDIHTKYVEDLKASFEIQKTGLEAQIELRNKEVSRLHIQLSDHQLLYQETQKELFHSKETLSTLQMQLFENAIFIKVQLV
jgi:GTPase SAR1 family protein